MSKSGSRLQPLFIGGTGRSGTTIFFKLLSQHPQIASLRKELRILVDPGGALDLISALSETWSPYRADDAIERLRRNLRAVSYTNRLQEKLTAGLRRCGVSSPRYFGLGHGTEFGSDYYHRACESLMNKLSSHVSRASWVASPPLRINSVLYETSPQSRATVSQWIADFFDDLYRNMGGNDVSHWMDSTPYNLLHVDQLMEVFPGTRFIHLYRDPRDILSSYATKSWGGDNPLVIARRLADIFQRWFDIRQRLPDGSYCEVALEQFTADPQGTMNMAMDFAQLNRYELPYTMVSPKKAHINRWKRDIEPSLLPAISDCLDPVLDRLGYHRDLPLDAAA